MKTKISNWILLSFVLWATLVSPVYAQQTTNYVVKFGTPFLGIYPTQNSSLFENSSGLIGLNNTSPAYSFDVTGTGHYTGTLKVDGNGIFTNGMVGIGLTNPGYMLDVNGTGHFAKTLQVDGAGTVNGGMNVTGAVYINDATTDNLGGALRLTNTAKIPNSTVSNEYAFYNMSLPNYGNKFSIWEYNNASTERFSIWDDGHFTFNDNTATTRVTILGNGNVGIGTITPAYQLDVAGTGHYTSTLKVDGNGIFTNGNVGIGTTTPNYALDVAGSINATGNYLTNGVPLNLSQWINGTSKSISYNLGSVGIGTETPAYQLDVAGTGRFTDKFYADNGAYFYGAVGMGVANPTHALEVGGQIVISEASNAGGELFLSNSSKTTPGSANVYALYNSTGYGNNGFSIVEFLTGSPNTVSRFNILDNGNVTFFNLSNNPMVTLLNSGQVGIGTSTPAQMLDVEGSVYFNGSLGIGTSTPSVPLSVVLPSTAAPSTQIANFSQGNNNLFFAINNEGGGYSYLTKNNDLGIFWNDGNDAPQNGLVIAPHNGGFAGIRIDANGNVGIGTNQTGTCKLAVEGIIGAREIKVIQPGTDFPDYVFAKDYKLPSFKEIEDYINENNHLKDIPSASEVEENNGINLGEMNIQLLKKVEEMTLLMIDENKKVEQLQKELAELKTQIKK